MNREEEQILKTIATAHDLVKNDNYLEAYQSLEVAIELEITQELRDKLRERYGNVVDHIEMRRFENSDYEVSIIFRNRFRRNRMSNYLTDQLIVENSMHKLCDAIDKMVFDRKPNMPAASQFSPIPNVDVRVSDRIPEGMIFISPKTYQEIIYSKQRQ